MLLICAGAIHSESGTKQEDSGPQTEDPDVVGCLLFLRGPDRFDHIGGLTPFSITGYSRFLKCLGSCSDSSFITAPCGPLVSCIKDPLSGSEGQPQPAELIRDFDHGTT